MTKAGHIIKIEVMIGTIKISEVWATLEMIQIKVNILEVSEGTLRRETGHMTEVEAGIEIIEEDLVGIEETVDLEIQVDLLLETEVKREGVSTVEKQDILYGSVRKRKGIRVNKGNNKHKCNK